MKETIAIIGAGPAGAVCACELAKAGANVLLFDHKAPWDKPCGGMMNPDGYKELSLFNDYKGSVSLYKKVLMKFPRNLEYQLEGKNPVAVFVRLELNKFLLDKATGAGAIHKKERVKDVRLQGKEWEIITEDSNYVADLLIGADGVNSLVRKKMVGKISLKNISVTCGYNVINTEYKECFMKYGDIIGYMWEFPNSEYTSIGIGAVTGSIKISDLMHILNSYIEHNHPRAKKIHKWSALVPTISDPDFYSIPSMGERWLLTGDAAGLVNSLSGEGIFYAIKSGLYVSQAILSGDFNDYKKSWKEYGDYLKEHAKYLNNLLKVSNDFGPEMFGTIIFNIWSGCK